MRAVVAGVALLSLLDVAIAAESGGTHPMLAVASGGALTVFASGEDMLRWQPDSLSETVKARRWRGEAFFNTPFVPAPSPAAVRDGLGPLFNSVSCESCHNDLGRGRPVDDRGAPSVSLVLQLSAQRADGAWGAHPRYGDSLQPQAVPGVPAEGQVRVSYRPVVGKYADGERWELRQPVYHVEQLSYGAIDDAAVSPRMAQPLIGMGLLDAIPDAAILSRADPEDRDGDGISGRPNWVTGNDGERRLGRFGWKASQPDIRAQTVTALLAEQGISSEGSAPSNCAPSQAACLAAPDGGTPEISAQDLDSIVTFMRTVPVPARQGIEDQGVEDQAAEAQGVVGRAVRRGAALFLRAGCDSCHVPAWRTGPVSDIPELSDQLIYPFTDLLLHDMGPELADGRPDQSATGSEWRTAPLWGVGRVAELGVPENYLHDGRARTLEEAVLWHGGEGAQSRSAFLNATRAERDALIAFLRSL